MNIGNNGRGCEVELIYMETPSVCHSEGRSLTVKVHVLDRALWLLVYHGDTKAWERCRILRTDSRSGSGLPCSGGRHCEGGR